MNTINDKAHDISLKMRKNMSISGVEDVISFDDETVNLKTFCGDMTVEGKNIKISVLDTERGTVELEGTIDAVYYSVSDDGKKQGIFGRLLK